MDSNAITENLPLIISIVGIILLQFFMRRRRKAATTHPEIVQNLLAEVKLNQALVESFPLQSKPKRFLTTSWQMSKDKLDFLDSSLQFALSGAFTIAEDFNQQIAAANKHKSAIYMASVNMDKLREPLARSKDGLELWLTSRTGEKEPPPKYPNVFNGLFGG